MNFLGISEQKQSALLRRMRQLKVSQDDIAESFIKSSGPGGQNVNKVASCVFLCHKPTGISVKCQSARSQNLNRFLARQLLLNKIEQRQRQISFRRRQEVEKLKRQNRKRPQGLKERILEHKHRHSDKKANRKSINLNKFHDY